MSFETLTHPQASGKPAPSLQADLLPDAAVDLLDRLAIRLDPDRAASSGRRGILLANRVGPDGEMIRCAWMAGPVTAAIALSASQAAEPVGRLIRLVPGGEVTVYRLAAAARRMTFRANFSGLGPAEPRPPPARAVASLDWFHLVDEDGRRIRVTAPPPERLFEALDRAAELLDGAVVVTNPRELRRTVTALIARRTLTGAMALLPGLDPELSAARRPSLPQRVAIVLIMAAVPLGLWLVPTVVWSLLHLVSAVCFVSLGYVRYVAGHGEGPPLPPPPLSDDRLPSYTVLVALYREAHMLPGLVAALDQLDYPADRLDVLLLLEADDAETRAAAERWLPNRSNLSVLVCPPGVPRTKPRALCYGLAFCRSEFVTVFDAEDRPHPLQLREAAASFEAGPADLACLQARLSVDRIRNRLQQQFAIEYAVLFDGFLPWLGARRLPIPLGGTSNHFRRAALSKVLGWDPYNVTEDADLGLRLMRYGFIVDVVDSATLEEAPARVRVWLAQRRRWIKGWMITWLVHTRRPVMLVREIGLRNAGMMQLHALASVGAPLCHPIGLVLLALHASGLLPLPVGRDFAGDMLFAASTLGLLFGYGGSVLFARRMLVRAGRKDLSGAVWIMPLYWLLASFAAWRALYELVTAPHHWSKTPHEAHDRPEQASGPVHVQFDREGEWSG